MGTATIKENLGDGKYKIEIDKATEQIAEEITKLETKINQFVDVLIPAATEVYNTADGVFSSERSVFNTIVAELKAAQAGSDQGDIQAAMAGVRAQTKILLESQAAKNIALRNLQTLNLQLLATRKGLKVWTDLRDEAVADIREVWAVDYTPTLAVGTKVGTVEINGESAKKPTDPATGLPSTTVAENIQITPAGSATKKQEKIVSSSTGKTVEEVAATDGSNVRSVGMLSPGKVLDEQEFFVAEASKPGWQRWKPTFRIAEITEIDFEHNTCNVTLDSAQSSVIRTKAVKDIQGQITTPAAGFEINDTENLNLSDVVFDYMTCNSSAFVTGDKVVIEFLDQDWENPCVKGFVESPRACHIQVKIRMKTAKPNAEFLGFATDRLAEWQKFKGFLSDLYDGAGNGVIPDLVQWHQDSVGKAYDVFYIGGIQNE